MKARPPVDPDAFAEAVAWFRSRLILTDDEFAELEGAAHDRAFTIAGVAELDMVTDVWEAVDRAVANGETLEDFKASTQEKLASAWGGDRPWRVETIYRTNMQQAYGRGRWEQMEHPAVKAARPFRQFSAILDMRNKDCPVCPPIDTTIQREGSAFIRSHWPPLHPNCRCHWVTLSESEAEEAGGATEDLPEGDVSEGFGDAPNEDSWEPDLSEYPGPLAVEYAAG